MIYQGDIVKIGGIDVLCVEDIDFQGKHFLYFVGIKDKKMFFGEENEGKIRVVNNKEEKIVLKDEFQKKIGDEIPFKEAK